MNTKAVVIYMKIVNNHNNLFPLFNVWIKHLQTIISPQISYMMRYSLFTDRSWKINYKVCKYNLKEIHYRIMKCLKKRKKN